MTAAYVSDSDRFQFMRDCVSRTGGLVLNVGCHVDGANLKANWPMRVLNCDVAVQQGYAYDVDILFDARHRWPFADDEAEMVVLGDILEHMYDHEIVYVLREAARVAWKVCITVPHDEYLRDPIDRDAAYRAHCNTIDRTKIERLLDETGWDVDELHVVEYRYEVTSEGYLVLATRRA